MVESTAERQSATAADDGRPRETLATDRQRRCGCAPRRRGDTPAVMGIACVIDAARTPRGRGTGIGGGMGIATIVERV